MELREFTVMVTGTLTVEQIHYELGLICENLADGLLQDKSAKI